MTGKRTNKKTIGLREREMDKICKKLHKLEFKKHFSNLATGMMLPESLKENINSISTDIQQIVRYKNKSSNQKQQYN